MTVEEVAADGAGGLRAGTAAGADPVRFARNISWVDGFWLVFSAGPAIFALIGYSVGVLGAWTAMALWAVSTIVALLQIVLFAEMAAMFPNKPGGISLYAFEAWRKYFSPVGPLAAVGYWAGWSFALGVYATVIGGLIQAQFFPGATWTVYDGTVHLGLQHFIGVGTIVLVWALNVFGIRPAAVVNRVIGILAGIVIAMLLVGPFATGKWSASHLTWGLGQHGQAWGGWKLALVYLYVMGWSAYSAESAASYSPEYKDQKRDSRRALGSVGVLLILFMTLGSIAPAGVVSTKEVVDNPVTFLSTAFHNVLGGGSGFFTVVLCLALFANMINATADAGRAMYGIARDGMVIKQLDHLNKHHMPARAMTLDLVINTLLVLFVGNTLGILFASNLGYMVAIFFAVTGFILLRRDRPAWPRPIRAGRGWVVIAGAVALFNAVIIIVGATSPGIAGYGGLTEALIGVGILLSSLVLFVFRRRVQDRIPLRLREPVPATPAQAAAMGDRDGAHEYDAEKMLLLNETA
jgi:amino acid transporter